MATKLEFTYGGKEYTLEFTRKTVKELDRRGFKASELTDQPMTYLPMLFSGAFLANHRSVRQEKIDEIFEHMTNKSDLIGKLAEMYNEPLLALIEDPAEDAEGNVDWTVTQ